MRIHFIKGMTIHVKKVLLLSFILFFGFGSNKENTSYAEGTRTTETGTLSVSGLTLQYNTPYTVYLEPTADCTPDFLPSRITLEFDTSNSCILTYEGMQIAMGRHSNDKYMDLFSLKGNQLLTFYEDDPDTLMIFGACDTDCNGADFAIRVSAFIQGENMPRVFGEQKKRSEYLIGLIQEPIYFPAGNHTLETNKTYNFRIVPDDSCDIIFVPFEQLISFHSENVASFLTPGKKKNVLEALPAMIYREDNGWIEFSAGKAKFWGFVDDGLEGADLTFRVVGLENNLWDLFDGIATRRVTEPEPEPEPEPTPLLAIDEYDAEFYFYYGILNDEEKVVYSQIIRTMNACEKSFTLQYPVPNAVFNRIFWYVLYDQPQIFWTDRRYTPSYNSYGLVSKVQFSYNELADNIQLEQSRIESAANRILAGTKGMNAFEAERYVHDCLVKETTYVANSPNNQNIYSILVSKETVCAGYARAFQYLMQKLKIPCYYCTGETTHQDGEKGRHAWNVIKLNGEWYNVDVTWDDRYREKNTQYNCISYEYYNVTDKYLSVEHSRNADGLLLPICNATHSSFENLYGHDWQTEIAKASGITLVRDLNDYFSLCYDQLMKKGVGSSSFGFIVTDEALCYKIEEQSRTKEYVNAYLNPYLRKKKMRASYSYNYQYYVLSSRGKCYYFDMYQKIVKR